MTEQPRKEDSIMKNRIIALITILALASALAACGSQKAAEPAAASSASKEASAPAETAAASSSVKETSAPAEEASEASSVSEEPETQGSAEASVVPPAVTGGWSVNSDETTGYVPEEAQAAFDKACEGFVGQDFEILAYLGSQVVAGTNHMFLCRGTTVTREPVTALKVVIVYADLNGNAEITGVKDFDLGDYSMVDNQPEAAGELVGGWTVYAEAPAVNLPAPAVTAYDKVMDGLVGADYVPLALLGSQIVSGTNYAVLARQTLVTQNPVSNMCLVFVYAPLNGDPELLNIYTLDLASFNE